VLGAVSLYSCKPCEYNQEQQQLALEAASLLATAWTAMPEKDPMRTLISETKSETTTKRLPSKSSAFPFESSTVKSDLIQ
jgi:hypothetical protein